ncbi:DUF5655 domain-containing protein [Pedobacter boryungensis]|uniref:DUF5655 domain-containing protein n=1 Tax=Pedobacter boryungensis TaxID=869962 RepID=A0ABX2DIB8_9SPHI|nr:DUF5655 domain-containing protein [Pedobacter boryungensis]NQX32854.1 hypothetical protein [Pedobacter boryungensis]
MWTCVLCNQTFQNPNQIHYCGDKTIDDFLIGKSDKTIDLFNHFITKYKEVGDIKLHATKTMIALSANKRFAYIIKLGKDFIDIVFPFKEPFEDNYCFRKIAAVPGSNDYNHHLRIYLPEDVNDEVLTYMKKAYINGKDI